MINWIPVDAGAIPEDRRILFLFQTNTSGTLLHTIDFGYYSRITLLGRQRMTHWAECNLPE